MTGNEAGAVSPLIELLGRAPVEQRSGLIRWLVACLLALFANLLLLLRLW